MTTEILLKDYLNKKAPIDDNTWGSVCFNDVESLTAVIENLPNMVFVKDAKELRLVQLNKAGETLIGHPRSNLIGKNDYDFFPREQADFFVSKDREVLSSKKTVYVSEEPIETPHLGTRILRTKKIPLLDTNGNPEYLLGISEDITEEKIMAHDLVKSNHELEERVINRTAELTKTIKKLEHEIRERRKVEEELRKEKIRADEASEAKGQFLANMSHEIRTPLAILKGYSELLINKETSSAERQNISEVINRNSGLLNTIIGDILDISKIESQNFKIEPRTVSTKEILTDLASAIKLESADKDLVCKVNTTNKIPTHIFTDPHRLQQILLNIVGNALKYTHKGHVTVSVSAENWSEAMDCTDCKLNFLVEDTGAGIPDHLKTDIFNPFTQLHNGYKKKYGGIGLGLYLAKSLSKLLNGDIKLLKSETGKGSSFLLTIGCGEFSSSIDSVNKPLEPKKNSNKSLKGLKVLLVEDFPDLQVMGAHYMNLLSWDHDLAENGKEALDKALKGNYDVIFMDLQMPVMDGYEAVRNLRLKGYKGPIIALTGHAFSEEKEKCLRQGFDEHIAKPINKDELIRVVNSVLNSRKREW